MEFQRTPRVEDKHVKDKISCSLIEQNTREETSKYTERNSEGSSEGRTQIFSSVMISACV